MKKRNKSCRSCGLPFRKDPRRYGTNADGTTSETYCNYCYQNGVLAGEGLTVGEFQEFVRREMIRGGHSRFMAWICTRGYRRLERWKTN